MGTGICQRNLPKRTPDYEKFGFIQKRKYSPENTKLYLGLLSHIQKLKKKKLDLRADQNYSRCNIQFFGFNTNRSAKAYYFRHNYDQWATVGFRLFKTKTPSFLPAGLQKGKKSKLSKVKQNGDIRREGEQTSIVLHLFSMIKTWMFQFSVESPCTITFCSCIHVLVFPWVCFLRFLGGFF